MALAPKQSGPEILRRFVPLNTLRDDALERLVSGVVFEKLSSGDTLFHEGDTDHFNVYLLSGRVVLQSGGKDVDTVDAGSNTARFPLAHQIPRKYRAMAKTRVEIARVDNRQLGELLAQTGSSTYEVEELEQGGGDWMSQLLQSRVFQQIPAANIQSVMMRMQEHDVKEGECIIRQGEDGDYFYLINQGRCSVQHQGAGEDEPREVAQLGPGDSFGEEALLSDRPRGSTVIMLSDGVLLRLNKDDFVQFVKRPLAREIDFASARDQVAAGAHWLDVRSAEEYAREHLPNAISLPFAALRYQATSLDPGQHYILYCEDGQQSASATYLMIEQGFQVSLLIGGLAENREQAELEAEESQAEVVSLRPEDALPEPGAETAGRDEAAAELRQKLLEFERKAQEQLRGMKKLKLALDKAKVRIQSSEGSLAEVQQAHDSLAEERDGLNQQLEALQQELEQARAAGEQAEQGQAEQIKALEEQLAERDKSLQELKEQLAQGSELEQQLTDAKQASDALAEERDGLSQQLEALQQELEQARAAGEQAEQGQAEQIKAHEAQLAERNASLEELKAQLAQGGELEQSLVEARQARDTLSEERDGLSQQFEALQQELEQARAAGEQAEQGQAEQIKTLEQQLAERDSSLEELKTQLAHGGELEQSLAEAQQARDTLAEERDRLNQQLEALQQELEQARAAAEQSGQSQAEQIKILEEQLAERDQSFEELKVQLVQGGELEQSLDEARQARDTLAEERDGLNRQLEKLQQELEQARTAGEQAGQDQAEQVRTLEQQLAERDTSLEALKAQLAEHDRQLESLSSGSEETEGLQELRQELEEAVTARAELEEKLRAQQQAPDGDAAQRIHALEAELETLTLVLEESDKEHDTLKAELLALRQAGPEVAGHDSPELEQLREALQLKEVEFEALRSELELVRERSEQDIREMRAALAQAESQVPEPSDGDAEADQEELKRLRGELEQQRLSDSADAAENAALKQDMEKLQKQLGERDDELEKLRRAQLQAEERLEDGHSELDELKSKLDQALDDAEEAQFREQEATEARKQLEQALYRLQEELERKRGESPGESREPALGSDRPLDLDELSSPRRGWVMALAGAVVSFVLADGLAIISGKGELISGLISGGSAPVVATREAPSPQPPRPQLTDATDSRPTQDSQAPAASNPAASGDLARADSARLQESRPKPAVQAQPEPTPARPEPARRVAQAVAEPVQASQPAPQPVVPARPENVTGKSLQDRLRSGGAGPAMVMIAGGEFTMGSDRSLIDLEERPAHLVAVPAFAMAKTEVTFQQYRRFAEATGRQVPDDLGWGAGSRPVINVSWDDATAYARWLSEQTGESYRLPTEAEWEFAAAAGNDALYWWGYDLGEGRANCFNCGSQWDGKSSAPVGSFDPNPWGLHDMLGNVMEWVSDCFHPNYQGAPSDGTAWLEDGCSTRVVRGGAFNKPGKSLRVTRRDSQSADTRLFSLGFRVVRELP